MTSASPFRRNPILGGNPRARWLLSLFLVLLVGMSLYRLSDPSYTDTLELNGVALGTTWLVKVVAPDVDRQERDRIYALISEQLDSVDDRMSTWDSESELSRFNRSRSTAPFAMSQSTMDVFELAREVSEQTGGAFDITVGPLVRTFGFGAGAEPIQTEPGDEEIARLRERVGYSKLKIDQRSSSLRKDHAETEADLSAIAKGYAVDRIAKALESSGYHDFLAEVGGELAARGARSGGGSWRVAIEQPDAEGRSIFAIAELRDTSMATSGDYRTYTIRDGVRLSHLIDPRSMRPVAHNLASVTVIDPSTARADALATGLGVLGPEAGFNLAEKEEIAAYFIVRESGNTLRGFASARFVPYLAARQPKPENDVH